VLDADKRRLLPSSKRITLSSFGASAWKSLSSIGPHNSVSKLIMLDIFYSYFSSTATFYSQCPIFFRALPSGDYTRTAQLVRNNVDVCGMPPEVPSGGHLPLTRHGADSQSRLCCDGAFCMDFGRRYQMCCSLKEIIGFIRLGGMDVAFGQFRL
jgi:hypothetical protein